MKDLIRVVGYRYGDSPKIEEMEADLISMQGYIEGYIEVIELADNYCLIVNELGRLEGLPYDSRFNVYGNFILAKVKDSHIVSMDEFTAKRSIMDINNIINKRKQKERLM